MTALAPNESAKALQVAGEVSVVVRRASELQVQTLEQAQAAAGFLTEIQRAKRASEAARRFLVEPLNRHVKAINDRFKSEVAPLDEADRVVRGKMLAYQQAQATEQARVDAERREQEAAAEQERRRQAENAARLEREAAEAERARQAVLREAANERAREIAAMSDPALEQLAVRMDDEDVALRELVTAEMSARLERRQEQEAAQAGRRQADEAAQREVAAKSVAPAQQAKQPDGVSTRKVWKATVVDGNRIPREYLDVNTAAINAAVRSGVREIPGVLIEQVDQLAVRS